MAPYTNFQRENGQVKERWSAADPLYAARAGLYYRDARYNPNEKRPELRKKWLKIFCACAVS